MMQIECACGCGRMRPKYDSRGRERIFIKGHYLSLFEPKRGADHPRWNGGRRRHERGYILIYRPEHPHSNKKGLVYEHRLIVEAYLGRYLERKEAVHHLNGIRDDNRIENLRVYPSHGIHISDEMKRIWRDRKVGRS